MVAKQVEPDPDANSFDGELSPRILIDEITAADVRWRALLQGLDDEMARYAGPGRGALPVWDPENHAFEWVVMFASQVASGDANVRLTSTRQGKQSLLVRALEAGANRWIRQTDLRGAIDQYAVDFAFRWCVSLVRPAKVKTAKGAEGDPPYMPIHERISPRYYRADSTAETREKERWRAHLVIRPIAEVIKAAEDGDEPGWDLELLRDMQREGCSMSDRREAVSPEGWTGAEREDLAYWEVWVRDHQLDDEHTPDEGFTGAIFTVVDQKVTEKWPRKPRAFFGLRDGPYEVGGAHTVMDEPQPLAPLVAHKAQAEARNRVSRAILAGVEAYKRLIITRSAKLAEAIKSGGNDHVFAIEDVMDIAASAASLEFGGVSQQLLVADERSEETLQRVSGLADFLKGVSANITATEASQLGAAANSRIAHDVDRFERFVLGIIRRAMFYIMADDDCSIDLGTDQDLMVEGATGEVARLTRIDGSWDGDVLREFEALDITIEPESMSTTSTQRDVMKLQLMDATIQLVVQAGPMAPFINWDEYLRLKEQLTRINGLRTLVDTQQMRAHGQMLMQMQAQPAQPASPQPQPRMGFDASSKGGNMASSMQRGARKSPAQMAQPGAGGGMNGSSAKPQGGLKSAKSAAGAA